MNKLKSIINEPYRLFFPLGVLYLLMGALVWVPLIWNPGIYPVLAHRFLMLNGFVGSFVGGFLMTAVPKFSRTESANPIEVSLYFFITLTGLVFAIYDYEFATQIFSAMQAGTILSFLLRRIFKRQVNPPYSFVFIFVGLVLWIFSAIAGAFHDLEAFKNLHYEGAIAAIILGVGSRLIPGILGHVEIVSAQRTRYEKPISLLSTVPVPFFFLIATFVGSYFLEENVGNYLRLLDVGIVALYFWKLYQFPKIRTSLTWSIWISAWLIVLSFLLKATWTEGMIHASHSFFINGIVLLSLLIATRVLQSHGPQDNKLENLRLLYVVTALIVFSAATRLSAFLMPETYLRHLSYASILLCLAVCLWGFRYLRFVLVSPKQS